MLIIKWWKDVNYKINRKNSDIILNFEENEIDMKHDKKRRKRLIQQKGEES